MVIDSPVRQSNRRRGRRSGNGACDILRLTVPEPGMLWNDSKKTQRCVRDRDQMSRDPKATSARAQTSGA